jgi:hypothetical protein
VVNFPKLKFSYNTVKLLLVLSLLIVTVKFVFYAPLINSIVISILILLLGIFIKGIWGRVKYNQFLVNIGEPISRETFYDGEYVISVIPFNNKASACSARIQDNILMFGRAPVYRALKLDIIDDIELQDYFGHQVARVSLLSEHSDDVNVFYVPWSELLEKEIEWCEVT